MGSEFAFDIRDNILCARVSRYYSFPMMMMLLLGSSSIFGVRPWTLWKFALVGEQDRGGRRVEAHHYFCAACMQAGDGR
jgi:hypothetical protein